jgi:hypothetical protein
VNSPERFEREVFGNRRIANDANNPAIHLCLKLPEQRLKGVGVSLPEAFQQFHGAFLLGLTGAVSLCYKNKALFQKECGWEGFVPRAASTSEMLEA